MKISYSSIKDFLDCPMKFKLSKVDRLRPVAEKDYFIFGKIIHEAIEALEKYNDLQKGCHVIYTSGITNQELAIAIITQYNKVKKPSVIKAQELYFEMPILYKDYKLNGFIDKIEATETGFVIKDFKTTSSITGFYLQGLQHSMQPLIYSLASQHTAFPAFDVIYYIIQKAALRQKQNETLDEFQQRLIEYYEEKPDMFQELEVNYTRHDLEKLQQELFNIAINIDHCISMEYFIKNTNQCVINNNACQYLPICTCKGDPKIIIENEYTKGETNESTNPKNKTKAEPK